MSVITNLNSGNSNKIELLLEKTLSKYENSKEEMERFRCKFLIDEIYAFERENASNACINLNKSIGYAYFLGDFSSAKPHRTGFSRRLERNAADDLPGHSFLGDF